MNVSSSGMESRRIGIVGIGYVGLPLAAAFAQTGERVVGFGLDQEKVRAINRGESYFEDVPSSKLKCLEGSITAGRDTAALVDCHAPSL